LDANGLAPVGVPSVVCAIHAAAVVHATPDQLSVLRRDPGVPLPASALRNADEQSVVGLAAVISAMRQANLTKEQCAEWGAVAAPRYLGRLTLTAAVRRFRIDGAWCMTPHIVPHQSQHAVAGVISQLLCVRGPCLGVGAGPGGCAEAAQTAATLLDGESAPGVWLVMTGWDPEPVLDEQNRLPAEVVCHALALGLTPAAASNHLPRLHVRPSFAPAKSSTVIADRVWFTGAEQVASMLSAKESSSRGAGPIAAALHLADYAWIELPAELDKHAA
jgi:hypothetical protein